MLTAHEKHEIYTALKEGEPVIELAEKYKLDFQDFSLLANSIIPEWGEENTETTSPHWVKVAKGFLLGFALERRTYKYLNQGSNTLYFIITARHGRNIQYYDESSLVKAILEEVATQNA